MRIAIVALLLATFASASLALSSQLDRIAPAKAPGQHEAPPAEPALLRQGGDTVADATVIPSIPYDDTGTTVGYTDDYDEVCPYSGSTAPDVVYTYTPASDVVVEVDLFGSTYDTKVYVYDENLNLVACNDDFYPDYVSKLENVLFDGGVQYFIVIDGWNGDAGDYVIAVAAFEPCVLDEPAGSYDEGEPPLVNDEPNEFNAGCGASDQVPDPFQVLTGNGNGELVLWGGSGWFLNQGSNLRDTDWFVVTFGAEGTIQATVDAEYPLYFFELGPQDCGSVAVIQNVLVGPCQPGTMTIVGEPFTTVWIWTGPTNFEAPGGADYPLEFDYILWLEGLAPGTVASEARSWSEVKSVFR